MFTLVPISRRDTAKNPQASLDRMTRMALVSWDTVDRLDRPLLQDPCLVAGACEISPSSASRKDFYKLLRPPGPQSFLYCRACRLLRSSLIETPVLSVEVFPLKNWKPGPSRPGRLVSSESADIDSISAAREAELEELDAGGIKSMAVSRSARVSPGLGWVYLTPGSVAALQASLGACGGRSLSSLSLNILQFESTDISLFHSSPLAPAFLLGWVGFI